jgi:predicted nucleic acid-binding Zn finger protein
VNTQKSAVDRPWKRTFLGFTFSKRGLKIKVSDKALMKLKATVRMLSRRTRGHTLLQVIAEIRKSLLGWTGFCSCKTCISTIHGGQSILRHRRSIESAARSG